MTRPYKLATLLLLITCGLAACGLPARGCASPQVYCAGLVTSTTGLEDHGLTQSAWEGLQQALQDGLVQQVDVIESVDPRDYTKNIATFSQQGYDLVITSGQGLRDETLEQARLHPEVRFLGMAQEVSEQATPNLSVMVFSEERGGFLAGALAAEITQTGVLAAVCETSELDSMRRYCQGFRAGAEYKNQQIEVLLAFHQTAGTDDLFRDEAWAARTTEQMILRGADVIYGVGGRLGQEALRAAAKAGAWSIGAEHDQFFLIREVRQGLLTSSVPRADEALYQFIKDIQAGRVIAELQGDMALAPYHDGERFISLSLQAAMLELKQALESGLVQVNIGGTR